jgi:flavin reductase (DIM6/NTAB) family NADH-FMN oxidoreductase RutF
LNSVHASFIERAHQSSAKYPDGINEFDEVGLTAEWKGGFPVPVVAESAIQYALKLVEIIPITHNNTYFIIGSIEQFWVDESLLLPDGFLLLDKAEVVTSTGLDAYYTTKPLARLSYAKPGISSENLEM